VDATEQEVITYYVERAKKDEEKRIKEILSAIKRGEQKQYYYQFTMTYDDIKKELKRKGVNK